MKVLIIGAGIGGPVLALALARAGLEPVVCEGHDEPQDSVGLFLGLGVNGMRVLSTLGALERVMATDCIRTPRMVFESSRGKELGSVSNGWLDGRTPSITLMRGALQRALVDELHARGIEVHRGKRLLDYEETGTRVIARFTDGSALQGDMLVGADGIHSRVRAQLDPHAPEPSYTGLLNLGGIAPAGGRMEPTPEAMHMVWGRRAFFGYTVRDDGETWWFANVGAEEEPSRDALAGISTVEWKARLAELFEGDPAFITDIIERTPGTIGAYPIHDMPMMPRWHRGRVALLGDAAHAVSPSSGQGASMAMEDAIVLAKCLRDVPTPEEAFALYEALRRERASRIVETGRKRGQHKAVRNPLALFFRDLLLPIVFRLFATERSMAWIYDYDVPWEEPVAK